MTETDLDLDLVVIGGGIAGLAIAWETARAGRRVTVLEAADHTGGMLRAGRVAGVDVDLGAESFAIRTSGMADLIADAELGLTTVAPRPRGAHLAFPGAFGHLRRAPLPRRAIVGIPADPTAADVVRIVGTAGARRAAQERTRGPWRGAEPDLAQLVTERLGPRIAQRLVDPLCRSVYSRAPETVRLSDVQPALWETFLRIGSLLDAVDALAPASRAGSAVRGIDGGMWRLAAHLRVAAEAAGARIRTGAAVRALEPVAGGVLARLDDGTVTARRAVIATGPGATARLLGAPEPATPAVQLVTAAVTADVLDGAPVGSGVIVASGARVRAKALTHADAKWEWLAAVLPEHTHIVRLSARDADAGRLESPEDIARELRALTGAAVRAEDVRRIATIRWSDAVGTPDTAGDETWDAVVGAAAERGIRVAGAVAAGTGLASVIPHARAVARELLAAPAPAPASEGT